MHDNQFNKQFQSYAQQLSNPNTPLYILEKHQCIPKQEEFFHNSK
jgi:hypothetical protein